MSTLLALLLDTGLRIDEAPNIQEKEVDFDNLLITVAKGKGGRTRKVPFSPELRKRLFVFITQRNPRWTAKTGH